VLLFGGIFCGYFIFRTMYPAAWHEGSGALDWRWGGLNTIVLLIPATRWRRASTASRRASSGGPSNLAVTLVCGAVSSLIKLTFEYIPKWSGTSFLLDPSLPHYKEPVSFPEGGPRGLWQYVEGYYGGNAAGSLFAYPFRRRPAHADVVDHLLLRHGGPRPPRADRDGGG